MNNLFISIFIYLFKYAIVDALINLDESKFINTKVYKCPVKELDFYTEQQIDPSILIFKNKYIDDLMRSEPIVYSSKASIFHHIKFSTRVNDYTFSYAYMSSLESLIAAKNITYSETKNAKMETETDLIDVDKIDELMMNKLDKITKTSPAGENITARIFDISSEDKIYKCYGRNIDYKTVISILYPGIELLNLTNIPNLDELFKTSFIVLDSDKYSIGDIIYSNQTSGYLETLKKVDFINQLGHENENRLILETRLTNCIDSQELIEDILVFDKTNNELECLSDFRSSLYVKKYVNDEKINSVNNGLRNRVIQGRYSSNFGIKIISKRKIGTTKTVYEGITMDQLNKFNKLQKSYSLSVSKGFSYTFSKDISYDISSGGYAFATASLTLSAKPSIDIDFKATIETKYGVVPKGVDIDSLYITLGLELGFDASLTLNVPQSVTKTFPDKTLINDLQIAVFQVPISGTPPITLPGSLSLSLTAGLELSAEFQKEIDISISYAKSVLFEVPFLYSDGGWSKPKGRGTKKTYSEEDFNPDFSQLFQLPKLGAVFSLTPSLIIRWPDFDTKKRNNDINYEIKEVPKWLLNHRLMKRESLTSFVSKYIQVKITGQLPLLINIDLTACSSKCTSSTKSLEAALESTLGNFQISIEAFDNTLSFKIPINIDLGDYSICIPFPINLCTLVKSNNLIEYDEIVKSIHILTCDDNPCKNGGLCTDDNGGFECQCRFGFKGQTCDTSTYPFCAVNPCKNGGTCYESLGVDFCVCFPGVTGENCELNPCTNNNQCLNNGVCSWNVHMGTKFSCKCQSGYIGNLCEKKLCNTNNCLNDGICYLDSNLNQVCLCPNGYIGNRCEYATCDANPCENSGTCTMTSSTQYQCTCLTGFSGTKCEINPCHTNPCQNLGVCSETDNNVGYECKCTAGYTGTNCQYTVCATNNCQNGGVCAQTVSGNTCLCTDKYSGTNCETPNSCASNPCLNKGKCGISGSSYTCLCPTGYSGINCQITPCSSNPCQNGATCQNFGETFDCVCPAGYSGLRCEISACSVNPCKHNSVCSINESGLVCTCATGYSGIYCEKSPCDLIGCKNDATCIYSGSTHTCICPYGYSGTFCEKKN